MIQSTQKNNFYFIPVVCSDIVCEYKNCKQEAQFYQALNDSEEAYYKSKTRCIKHKPNN